jgi:hypothetical protein
MVDNEWYLYVFNILNIQTNETFFLNDIHECSCLIHKNHIYHKFIGFMGSFQIYAKSIIS